MKQRSLVVLAAVFTMCFGMSLTASAQSCAAPWQVGLQISVGEILSHVQHNWKSLQGGYTSITTWEPENTPALWSDLGPCSGGGGGTPTPTPTPGPTPKPSPTPSPTPGGGGGGSCAPAWNPNLAYCNTATTSCNGGNMASKNGLNFTANFWNMNQDPTTNNGPLGSGQPWFPGVSGSGGGGGGPTPTPTPKPSPSPTPSGTPPPPPPPGSKMFAPYDDISLAVGEQVVSVAQQAGLKAITLAFMVDGGCTPVWGGLGGGITANFPNGTSVQSAINQLEANGVAVIVSFGGANGSVLSSCGSASQAQAMYQQVINAYHVAGLDFDIEGGVNISVLMQALAGLQRANPGVSLSLTLPVLPTGLVTAGTDLLNGAHAAGFTPNVVNVMAMDFGSGTDNLASGGSMGQDAVMSAQNTLKQVQAAGLSSAIGVTPMIGVNDTNTEVFQFSDANTLLNFANSSSFVKRLAFWSLGRDNGGCAGQGFASATCSGVSQSNFQFSQTFKSF